jgi:hypothetical protein
MDDFQPGNSIKNKIKVPPKSVSLSDEVNFKIKIKKNQNDAEAVTALMILGFKEPNASEGN